MNKKKGGYFSVVRKLKSSRKSNSRKSNSIKSNSIKSNHLPSNPVMNKTFSDIVNK